MGGFRSLDENEVVDFESKSSDKGVEAILVTGPDKAILKGCIRKRLKRFRKTRYVNFI